MNIISRTGIVLVAVAIAMAGATDAFAKGKKNKGDKEHHVKGKITAVDGKTVTIESKKHGTQHFQLSGNTVFEKASKTGAVKKTKAKHLKVGKRAVVSAKGGVAQKVAVGKKHRKGAAASPAPTNK